MIRRCPILCVRLRLAAACLSASQDKNRPNGRFRAVFCLGRV
nr:MAG TPA: hypothetical protein [Caudoviricetes sp.]